MAAGITIAKIKAVLKGVPSTKSTIHILGETLRSAHSIAAKKESVSIPRSSVPEDILGPRPPARPKDGWPDLPPSPWLAEKKKMTAEQKRREKESGDTYAGGLQSPLV